MDDYIAKDFFRVLEGSPLKVIPIDQIVDLNWEAISRQFPKLPKPWFELAQLSPEDRIAFHCDFWIAKIPYHPNLDRAITKFFDSLEDITVYLVQYDKDTSCDPYLIYKRKDKGGYFRGAVPALEDHLLMLEEEFPSIIFPEDYLAFLQIHNGFWKASDITGLIPLEQMAICTRQFQKIIESKGVPTTLSGEPVNPSTLIPFYESFGMPFFQCFWSTWYPEEEMGNIYYSFDTNCVEIESMHSRPSEDELSFSSFLNWLMFYVEKIT